ncbi:MAG: 2-oxoacid:acceptor oxidoreductase family protein, partial [Lacisediminimonas sp.]|nr:2-oxoacid:acceptor oxidoreductase family protein [Lacisediminimonas sp.]
TGVITVGQIIAMAAHVEGRACSVLDMSGLAQKGGPVLSHVRLAEHPEDLHATRVGTGAADLVIGCDLIVAASRDAVSRMGEQRTRAAINSHGTPTAAFVRNPDWQFPAQPARAEIERACGSGQADFLDATRLATALMGDSIATNMFMLGYAWQKGWLPLSEAAIARAIVLNDVSVEFNQQSFHWGRVAAHDLPAVERIAQANVPAQVIEFRRSPGLEDVIATRERFLLAYQDAAYARQYRGLVDRVRQAELALGEPGRSLRLSEAVAKYLFKLMAYKDEYEVARLHANTGFEAKIAAMFEGDYKIRFHLAPPLLAKRDANGHLQKKEYGPWMMKAFRALAAMRFLRGTVLDVFGYTEERRTERAL